MNNLFLHYRRPGYLKEQNEVKMQRYQAKSLKRTKGKDKKKPLVEFYLGIFYLPQL